MQLKQRIAAVPQHRLDQRKLIGLADYRYVFADGGGDAMHGAREKLRLQQALAKLLGRIGVNDHATTRSHSSTSPVELQRANGHMLKTV